MAKQQISAAFASVFDRVLTTADKTLNAMKHTYLAKRNFWESAIEESLYIDSVELKAELYKMKLKADDLYLDAVEK